MDGKFSIYQNSVNESGTIQVRTIRDCLQGGILSPLMWSQVIDELLKRLSVGGLFCIRYANDIVIIARGKFEGTFCDLLRERINITKRWCNTVGLTVNAAKTTLVPFTRRTKLCDLRILGMNG